MLTATILSLAPGILWIDFVAPFSVYDVWRRTQNEIVFRVSDRKPDLGDFDTEVAVFRVLVAPTLLPSWLGLPRPEYTRFAFPDDMTVELAGIQPSMLAWQYAAVAVPTWSVLISLCYALVSSIRRFVRRRLAD